jgi:hypothetical protein
LLNCATRLYWLFEFQSTWLGFNNTLILSQTPLQLT